MPIPRRIWPTRTLAPWRCLDPVAGSEQSGIHPVHIRVVEDQAAPPRPLPRRRLGDQVHKISAGLEAGEALVFTAIQHGESEHSVESDRTPHVVRREGDRADALDHHRAPPTRQCRRLGVAPSGTTHYANALTNGPATILGSICPLTEFS